MAQTPTDLNVQNITCSITGNIMKNPVMAADGHTYDTLLPNYALKNVIETNAMTRSKLLPKPSHVTSTTTSVAASGGMTQVYNNSSSICFHGHCKIKMSDGSTKLLCNIRTGDTISTPYGNTSVKFITKQECINGACEMVVFQKTGLIVTPTHPIKYDDKWVHPKMIYEPSVIKTGYIYNLVLNEHHSCYINDMECITIGHGQTADILSSYFGTCEAVNDLSAIGIQSDGFVHISQNSIWRNEEGYVCKISVDL